jgi:transposase-like protein
MPTARRTFPPEFKAEAVKLVTEQGRSFVEAAVDPPGRGQAAHDGARHLGRSDGLLRQGLVRRYCFVESHRGRWPVRIMCRVLRSPLRATTTDEEAA